MIGCHARRAQLSVLALALASALLPAFDAAGQQAATGTDLFFDTVDVQVVNLEVVVTAEDGPPVTGLTADDFEVLVDGRPVPITNFFEVVDRQTSVVGTGPVEGSATGGEEFLPSPETERLNLVVVLDTLNMRATSRAAIFDRLIDYLWNEFDRRDRVMLAVMDGAAVTVQEPFTNDPGLLVQTLNKLRKQVGAHARLDAQQRMVVRQIQGASLAASPGPSSGGLALDRVAIADFEEALATAQRLAGDIRDLAEARFQAVRSSLQAIGQFTDSLAGLPGRKAILYVSDGLQVRAVDALAQAWLNKYSSWIGQQNVDSLMNDLLDLTSAGSSSRFDASRYFDRLLSRAAINRVSFYPISHTAGGGGSLSPEFAGAGTSSGLGAMSPDVVALDQINREEPLLVMAEKTGGVASTRGTGVLDLLRQVVADFETFYSLGYTPPDGIDEEAHKVEVRVKAPGLRVRHLDSVQQKAPLDELRDLTLSALHYGMESNPLNVRLDPGQATNLEGNRYRVPVMVKIPFEGLLLLPEQDYHLGRVTLFVVARDQRGGVSPFQQVEMPIRIPNDRIAEAMQSVAAYELQLDVKGGPQRISIGVRDHLAKVDATVNLELNVGQETG
jgi:VWFA-related protein